MSLEVLVMGLMASLSYDQNLVKKGICCPLSFRCQPSLWCYSRKLTMVERLMGQGASS